MGGIGSGRKKEHRDRDLVGHVPRLDVRLLSRLGMLAPGRCEAMPGHRFFPACEMLTLKGEATTLKLEFALRAGVWVVRIGLIWESCIAPGGGMGMRPWFQCPGCAGRV